MLKSIKKLIKFNKSKNLKVGTNNENERVNWIEKTLKKIPEGSRLLDAGAGEQQFKKFCRHLEYVSQDFAEYNPDKLDLGLQVNKWNYGKLDIISDITKIPSEDNSFDAILCTEVFEHIVSPEKAIKEFSRLLKKGGFLIITAPFCSLTHFAPYHFYSGFNKFFYENVLENNQFEIINMKSNGNYFEYLAQELNRLKFMAEKYSKTTINNSSKKDIYKINKLLQELSSKDSNSSEILCFGYHVLAVKK